jgi:hypothetical protein
MKGALEEIFSKRMGYKTAVQSFHVPQHPDWGFAVILLSCKANANV